MTKKIESVTTYGHVIAFGQSQSQMFVNLVDAHAALYLVGLLANYLECLTSSDNFFLYLPYNLLDKLIDAHNSRGTPIFIHHPCH